MALVTAPAGAIAGALETARDRAQARAAAHTQGMDTCLKPLVVAHALGPGHPDVAAALPQLAAAYERQGRPEMAEALYQRALAIWEQGPGPVDEAALEIMGDLGGLYVRRGEPDKAVAVVRRRLDICERTLGPDHLELARTLERSAGLVRAVNRQAEADEMNARARGIREASASMLAPEVVDFGGTRVGTRSGPESLVLTNRTRGVLHVRVDISTLPGDARSQFVLSRDQCQEPVAVGGACVVAVEFAPTGGHPGFAQAIFMRTTVTFEIREIGTLRAYLEGMAESP
jgi:hypothetical protein